MLEFHKYQGTGNDFVIIDDRNEQFNTADTNLIKQLCDRRFGIGADGLMLLRKAEQYDFRMLYYNADGRESSMCGNGGRCMARFAANLGLVKEQSHFIAIDGPHEALISPEQVRLKMKDVSNPELHERYIVLDTGSPHYVLPAEQVMEIPDLPQLARAIRYNDRFREAGINVNFIESQGDLLLVRTYERGVEDETLSCGTGVTAAVIAHSIFSSALLQQTTYEKQVSTPGGRLHVSFQYNPDTKIFSNIWLSGPAEPVFTGRISC